MMIDVPRPLRDRLGDDGCSALVEVVNRLMAGTKSEMTELSVQRFERRLAEVEASVNDRISRVEATLNDRISQVEVTLNDRISKLEVDLETRQAERHASLLRWLVTLFVINSAFAAALKFLG